MLITLDSHTKKFFDHEYHRALAQEFVHLAKQDLGSRVSGLGGRIFGIRGALCPNGQQVIIGTERSTWDPAKAVGPCFVMENVHFLGSKDYLAPYAVGFKMSRLVAPKAKRRHPETSLRILEGGVWRYHFDRESGWGYRVNSLGQCYVRDLRVRLDEQESFYVPAYLDWKQFHLPLVGLGTCALLEMETRTFHKKLHREATNPQTPLFRALGFYQKSEVQHCQDILRLSVQQRKLAEKQLGAHVALELAPGCALAGVTRWAWPMWCKSHFLLPQPNGKVEEKPVPPALLQVRDEIWANLGFHPVPRDKAGINLFQYPTEEMLELSWLIQLACCNEEMSAHEIAIFISNQWCGFD